MAQSLVGNMHNMINLTCTLDSNPCHMTYQKWQKCGSWRTWRWFNHPWSCYLQAKNSVYTATQVDWNLQIYVQYIGIQYHFHRWGHVIISEDFGQCRAENTGCHEMHSSIKELITDEVNIFQSFGMIGCWMSVTSRWEDGSHGKRQFSLVGQLFSSHTMPYQLDVFRHWSVACLENLWYWKSTWD